ncbi:Sugar transporter SWEET1 [Caenorhabditis elegans]|uniref:Sugar transporter SWEET1 n=1 Tax=Caenorhabditis elegans TaxID=6239 RepID=Q17757_CAEEL|nr:Sugar transporter SWEET1 [Caenorhabditis elegans]CAA94322.1 Sugar transporter SWEET1 [Caenorhabditis elegans]|eukprot:NP_502000.1 Sugar transporter SWEET [Caenorhabditis elegans]
MFEIFTQGFSLLNLLSILAFFTTVGLFFCGIPICRQIWKRKDTKEISGAPFLMGVVGGCCWMTYGWLKNDGTVKWVTGCQVILYTTYTIFYWCMTKKKLYISLKVLGVIGICTSLVLAVHFFGMKIFHPLGIVCLTLNIADFAAPLGGIRVVIRRWATSTLPLPLCIANFLVSTEWFLYGLLKNDFYLIFPNGVGSLLAFIQLLLFIVLPRKPGQRAPIVRLWLWIRGVRVEETKEIVAELGECDEKDDKKMNRAQRWSQKIKMNVSTVAEELENVIYQLPTKDQFAYTHKIGDEDSSSEKTVETVDETKKAPVTAVDKLKDADRERKMRNALRAAQDARENALRRTISSPDLSE